MRSNEVIEIGMEKRERGGMIRRKDNSKKGVEKGMVGKVMERIDY